MKKSLFLLMMLLANAFMLQAEETWTATWATAPEYTGQGDMPARSLSNRSLREIVRVSIGGNKLRLKLSNEFSKTPVEIKSIFIADAKEGSEIEAKTAKYLTFNKKKNITIEGGKMVVSDPIAYKLQPLQRLAITINYGEATPENATSHRGSRTTSYIIDGEAKAKTVFADPERVDHWYNISAIDVVGGEGCIAVLGNSITDGRGSTTNKQNRWCDVMATALHDKGVNLGIANLGIGGNCVNFGGLSQPGAKRFDRDILGQTNVKYVILFEGVNDIGGATTDAEARAYKLVELYKEMIDKCHKQGIKVIGGTIMPFQGFSYFSIFREAARQYINDWIRTSGAYDAVIDFDAAMRDEANPAALKKDLQEDWLHPNASGYQEMGQFAAQKMLEYIQKSAE